MRKTRKDLDAKNVFLHFTQEQLNAQVLSLEQVVKNLKTENHLLNKGIKNLVEQIQVEKKCRYSFHFLIIEQNSETATFLLMCYHMIEQLQKQKELVYTQKNFFLTALFLFPSYTRKFNLVEVQNLFMFYCCLLIEEKNHPCL